MPNYIRFFIHKYKTIKIVSNVRLIDGSQILSYISKILYKYLYFKKIILHTLYKWNSLASKLQSNFKKTTYF